MSDSENDLSLPIQWAPKRERLDCSRSESVYSEDLDNSVSIFHGQRSSIVDDLLFEIYDRWHDARHDSFESDTFTECSSTSDIFPWRKSIHLDIETKHSGKLNRSTLESQSLEQVKKMKSELQYRSNCISARLVRQLKRRERRLAKLQHNFDLVTAILQASSQKRRIDTRMKFSIEPPPGDSAFEQWKDAMKAVARLPMGIPDSFRTKVWLSLSDNHIREQRVDWQKTMRFVFNEKSNPDDNNLGHQIVKDLHRTGCSGFSGHENEEDRASLKRVLLGFARWNKSIGYCQGFNIIAALLLDVTERREDDALKVMIYIVDRVLPESYYGNNLRALSVDMAVFRDLLRITFPKLSRHLDMLQSAAQDFTTGACYEPPLTNVFTMQWFLTMFATCLPKDIVLRVWDSLLLEGSEILLRTGLAIWGKLSRRILSASSADEFYSLMGVLTQDMMAGKMFTADSLIKSIYTTAAFDSQLLVELREKYTYNIRPFSSSANTNTKSRSFLSNMLLPSDEDEIDEEDLEAINCFPGFFPVPVTSGKSKGSDGEENNADISKVGPGAYGASGETQQLPSSLYMERMCTDINSLKKQYDRLKQRQNQAHIIIAAASASQQHLKQQHQKKAKIITPRIETPTALNHLFVGRSSATARNRCVTASPRIASVYPQFNSNQSSRRSSVQSNSNFESKSHSKSSDKGVSEIKVLKVPVTDKNGNNDAQDANCAKSQNKAQNTNHENKVIGCVDSDDNSDKTCQNDDITNNGDTKTCDISQESKESCNDSGTIDNLSNSQLESENGYVDTSSTGKDITVETSHVIDTKHNVENQSSETSADGFNDQSSEINRNEVSSKEQCNTCSNDTQRQSSVFEESEVGQGHLEMSDDSGLCSTTNSIEIENSPSRSVSNDSVTQHQVSTKQEGLPVELQDVSRHEKTNTENCDVKLPSNGVTYSPNSTIRERSISEDLKGVSQSDTQHTASRARSFSTDQALSDYTRSKNKPVKIAQPFNPFPVKHFNENRKKNCVKLGLYKTSTLQEFERQCKSKFVWSK